MIVCILWFLLDEIGQGFLCISGWSTCPIICSHMNHINSLLHETASNISIVWFIALTFCWQFIWSFIVYYSIYFLHWETLWGWCHPCKISSMQKSDEYVVCVWLPCGFAPWEISILWWVIAKLWSWSAACMGQHSTPQSGTNFPLDRTLLALRYKQQWCGPVGRSAGRRDWWEQVGCLCWLN